MLKLTLCSGFLILLCACSPKFDWREVHDGVSPYKVLMPGKPSQLSREIQIGQKTVTMHMTAVQIDRIKFAVGAAKMQDATDAQLSIANIKSTLLRNISGQISHEKTAVTNVGGIVTFSDEFDASGTSQAIRMTGRLVARGDWVYQILAVGPVEEMERDLGRDAVETFLNSFSAN